MEQRQYTPVHMQKEGRGLLTTTKMKHEGQAALVPFPPSPSCAQLLLLCLLLLSLLLLRLLYLHGAAHNAAEDVPKRRSKLVAEQHKHRGRSLRRRLPLSDLVTQRL